MTDTNHDLKSWRTVCATGFGLILMFAIVSWFSPPFEYSSQVSRPIILVTLLLLVATGVAYWALKSSLSLKSPAPSLVLLIVAVGISLRAIGLLTTPILEVDYYRYIWDGKVTAEGESPYHFSPARILLAEDDDDPIYQKMVSLSMRSESNYLVLQRIHFEDHRTIYPPVSQVVFAAAMKWFPQTATVEAHVIAIKAVLVLFDLMTMWLIYLLLRRLNLHPGWLIAYAWNPLVIKEISNGGHLDSIVAFSVVASIYLLTRWINLDKSKQGPVLPVLCGAALGLGVGAKLFPVVLFPALLITTARHQWSKAALLALSFVLTSALCLWPMYKATQEAEQAATVTAPSTSIEEQLSSENALTSHVRQSDIGKEGLSSFLSTWRMNDVFFSTIYENIKVTNSDSNLPWSTVTSNELRQQVEDWCRSKSLGGDDPAFFLTRIFTLALFACFYLWQASHIYREKDQGINFDRLTWIVAMFLFLQPTVNPWYWVWIAPLACLSKNSSWLLVSGFLLLYYSRFWFRSLDGSYEFAGTSYSGSGLFDHGVAWIEFACIFVVLGYFLCRKERT